MFRTLLQLGIILISVGLLSNMVWNVAAGAIFGGILSSIGSGAAQGLSRRAEEAVAGKDNTAAGTNPYGMLLGAQLQREGMAHSASSQAQSQGQALAFQEGENAKNRLHELNMLRERDRLYTKNMMLANMMSRNGQQSAGQGYFQPQIPGSILRNPLAPTPQAQEDPAAYWNNRLSLRDRGM